MHQHPDDPDDAALRAFLVRHGLASQHHAASLKRADLVPLVRTAAGARFVARADLALHAADPPPAPDLPPFTPRSLLFARLMFAATLVVVLAVCLIFGRFFL